MNLGILKSIKLNKIVSHWSVTRHLHNAVKLNGYRSLINVTGPDSAIFLQGMMTNDIYHLDRIGNRLMYSMILNSRGRVMFDVFVYQLSNEKKDETHYLVEVDTVQMDNALRFFKMFRVKREVNVSSAENDYILYSVMNSTNEEEDVTTQVNKNLIICQRDPRYKPLGYRMLAKYTDNLIVSDILNDTKEIRSLNMYKKFLYSHGIPESSEVIPYSNSIPLEYNIVFMNGVSFNKGCYLGQELIAKTHHTGVIRKRIMPLQVITDERFLDLPVDCDILNTKLGQSVGKLRGGIIDKHGLGLMRLSKINNSCMVLVDSKNGKKYPIRVHIPKYWQIDEALENELKTANLD